MEESKKFYYLKRAEKFITDKLKNDFRTKRHKNDSYSYGNTIRIELYKYYEINRVNIRYTISQLDNYSAKVLLYCAGVNHEFSFDGRRWIREDKLKKLL